MLILKKYINKVLEIFEMEKIFSIIYYDSKDKQVQSVQCPKNDLEYKQMEAIPYAFVVGSIMYTQTYTQL